MSCFALASYVSSLTEVSHWTWDECARIHAIMFFNLLRIPYLYKWIYQLQSVAGKNYRVKRYCTVYTRIPLLMYYDFFHFCSSGRTSRWWVEEFDSTPLRPFWLDQFYAEATFGAWYCACRIDSHRCEDLRFFSTWWLHIRLGHAETHIFCIAYSYM